MHDRRLRAIIRSPTLGIEVHVASAARTWGRGGFAAGADPAPPLRRPMRARLAFCRTGSQTESIESASYRLRMASERATPGLLDRASASSELGAEWRRLTRSATTVAIITSPAPFIWFYSGLDWGFWKSLVATFLVVIAFRGLVDLMTRRLLPWPSLYGTDDAELKEEDVVNRRRASFWRFWFRFVLFFVIIFTIVWLLRLAVPGGTTSWIDSTT